MSDLPRLRVKWGNRREKIIDLEQAKSLLPFDSHTVPLVAVDGYLIYSYDELVRLVSQERYKGKGLLELRVITPVGGG